jgi:hypothetical protein
MSAHTPGPLLVSESGETIYAIHGDPPRNRFFALVQAGRRDDAPNEELAANAARLALCWNTHDQLLEALEGLMELEKRGRIMPIGREWDAARAAIKAAKGEA